MSSTAVVKPSPASSRFAAPSTPMRSSPASITPQKSQTQAQAQQDTPGTWRHPNMDEINRRMNASTFNSDNVNRISLNILVLVVLMFAPNFVAQNAPSAVTALSRSMDPYASWALLFTRGVLVLNIMIALMPLFRPKDDMADLALSREQRKLLGLSPQETPLPPGQTYVTPPRYSRSSTPRSSAQKTSSGSPSSRRGSPSSFDASTLGVSRGASGSPFSASPLMQKAIGGAAAARASSPLDNSLGSSSTGVASGKASVPLNSKWLYERGKGSPTGRGVFA